MVAPNQEKTHKKATLMKEKPIHIEYSNSCVHFSLVHTFELTARVVLLEKKHSEKICEATQINKTFQK